MIPKRVTFLSDRQQVAQIDLDLLAEYRDDIEAKILTDGTDDAETVSFGGNLGVGFLTNLPRPKIGRVIARWFLLNDEEAVVTGVRSGQAFEEPPNED